jgi:hypothetical protein
MKSRIKNHEEALAWSLALGIMAPTEAKFRLCLKFAREEVDFLTEKIISRAKPRALRLVAKWEKESADLERHTNCVPKSGGKKCRKTLGV